MPNSYDIYLGGGRTTNPDTREFPSAAYDPLALIKSAAHKGPNSFAITRVLDPSPTAPTTVNGNIGDAALRNWIDFQSLSVPLAAGDILRVVPLPNGQLFDGFYWEVENPLAGFTFSVAFSRIGNAGYVAGSHVIPAGTIGTVLMASQSGAAQASGFRDAGGVAMVADTAHPNTSIWIGGSTSPTVPVPPGDILAVRIDALPAGTGAAAWGTLRLCISPLVRELKRGQW